MLDLCRSLVHCEGIGLRLSVDLWPNDAGLSGTHYVPTAIIDHRPIKLRPFIIASGPDVRLVDIMAVELADVPAVDFAAAQSASKAGASAVEANDAKDAAEEANVSVQEAASAVAEDRAQTGLDVTATTEAKEAAETASAGATALVGTIDETLFAIAIAFANSQARYINAHAFS